MPYLPKFLRCRGISSSTKKLKTTSAYLESKDNLGFESQYSSAISLKPQTVDPIISVELPPKPDSNCCSTSSEQLSCSEKDETGLYRTMPIFTSRQSTLKSTTRDGSIPSTSIPPQNSTTNRPSSLSLDSEETIIREQLKRCQSLLERQAEEAISIHNKDTLENDRLRRANRALQQQLRDLKLKAEEASASASDHGYNSAQHEDTISTSTSISELETSPNNSVSNYRVSYDEFERSDFRPANPGGVRGRRVALSRNGLP